ncbi:hypothetical protein [Kribbella speibonae]|uniref:SPFH domain-containing protein n=1 Tax=Kribbella speibonae TaxID=1572660 RepID=A0ABY2A6A4_9ACTN|nr:hypothetical protein [Kribbella speibonae]TCC24584.1 hypothetical protein E0H58_10135 [Kribbella speibonae]
MTQTNRPLVVRSGTFEPDRRRFKFRRLRLELPDVEHGQQLILLDAGGQATIASGATAGERAFAGYVSWVIVDAGGRDLQLDYADVFSTSYARYIVTVNVHVDVDVDATFGRRLALNGISSLEDQFRPTLSALLKRALRNQEFPTENLADPVLHLRKLAEDLLNDELVGRTLTDLPPWLTVTVRDIVVRDDAAAATHLVELRQARNAKQLTIARGVDKFAGLELTLKQRELLQQAIGDNLKSAGGAAMEAVLMDPSARNIQIAIATLQNSEAGEQNMFLEFVKGLDSGDLASGPESAAKGVAAFMDAQRHRDVIPAVTAVESGTGTKPNAQVESAEGETARPRAAHRADPADDDQQPGDSDFNQGG